MINTIIRFIWPIIARFCKIKIETQNHYNDPETEKKAKRSDVKPIRLASSFFWPVKNKKRRITSRFGFRRLYSGKRRMHYGIDVIGSMSYDIVAAESGVVTKMTPPDPKYPARFVKKAGKWIRIAPEKRAWSPYALVEAWNDTRQKYTHSRLNVKIGQQIKAGQVIGTYKGPAKPKGNGGLGNSYGAHLHFEVHEKFGKKWKPIDPEAYARKREKT